MHAPRTRGDISELNGLLLGTSGTGGVPQANDRVENKIIAIQECRADLQDFLQRTKNRLQAIADNGNDRIDNLPNEDDARRVLRGADSAQPLKPLPILTPTFQRRDEEKKVNTSAGEQAESVAHGSTSFSTAPLASERFATDAGRQMVADSRHNVPVARSEHGEPDWRVSNAFDRNTYYGPTDFSLIPDDSECWASSGLCSTDEVAASDAFCSGTPPIEFGGAHAQPSQKSQSSRLHLATQIRQN